jgi:hypothetical protein
MIIELLLTIFAWRKGWGPIALLPMGVGITIGVIGAAMSNSLVPAAIADLMIYAALITMLVAGRKKEPVPQVAAPAPASQGEIVRQSVA